MEISISDAKRNLSKLVQQLIDGKEDVIYISKNGRTVAKLTLCKDKKCMRLGAATKEMKGLNLSFEEFNNIPIGDFYAD